MFCTTVVHCEQKYERMPSIKFILAERYSIMNPQSTEILRLWTIRELEKCKGFWRHSESMGFWTPSIVILFRIRWKRTQFPKRCFLFISNSGRWTKFRNSVVLTKKKNIVHLHPVAHRYFIFTFHKHARKQQGTSTSKTEGRRSMNA
jgi:hypothetical protein